ncbi:MAG: guanylate kinase [Chloroflexi bacterium]|nr:guanylate kinase [Chloroflexota bacterium]
MHPHATRADGAHPPALLVVISGPSGVGKDAVLERMKGTGRPWRFIVTATTRPRRPAERDGVDYIFMTPSDFEDLLIKDGFLEHALVYGRYYGVPRDQVEHALASGKDVVLKTDVQGAATLRSKMPGALLIFLAPPDLPELERRLRERKTDSAADIERRIATATHELGHQADFDYVVVNHTDCLDQAVGEIEGIMAREKERRSLPSPLGGEG